MADPIVYQLNTDEFIRAEVSSKIRTGAQLVALPIEMAIAPKGTKPTNPDWGAAAWEASPAATKAVARRLYSLDTAGAFDVYTRHTDSPEVPIKNAGTILVK